MSADGSTAQRPHTVQAQWAVVSKRLDPSGTHAIDGYEVVGTSGSMALAQSLQEACLTGTPSSTAVGTPDALPWVIVTAGGGKGPVMAMSVVTSSALRTEGGRAVTPTRLLWTTWADAARCRMSWAAMAIAHQSVRWSDTVMPSQAQGDPVAVQVADIAAATVADDIERFGFDWVAGLAGLVLDGRRIAIVAETTPLPEVDERLRLFDAVCALLPYGCRARFSAATWAKANVEHGVLLVFSDAVAKNQHRVVWQALPPRPRRSDATGYVEALLRLRHGEAKFRTLDIVQHLVGESDPRRCGDAAAALRCLLRMDLPREVVRLIRSGHGRVADVQLVLSEHPLDRLPSQIAQTLLQFLADHAEQLPAARDLLVQTWSAETERRLGAYGRSFLTAADLPRLRPWFEVAERTGPASKLALLRELLRPTDRMPDLSPASADLAVQLLSEFKGAINEAAIQRVIVDQPTICVALMREILDRSIPTGRAVEQIDRWLRDPSTGGRPWLVPFGFAIGRGEPTDEQWRALRDIDDRVWLVLLQIAAFGGQSGRVFASMWPFLVDRAGRRTTPTRDVAFNAELKDMTPSRYDLPDIDWALIDVLNLIRFGSMPGLSAGAVPLEHYGEAFHAAWYAPNLADRRAGLNSRLVAAIFPESGTAAQAAMLMSVVSINDPELMHLAARAIAREIDTRPGDFGSLAFSPEWITQIRRVSAKETFWVYQGLRTLVRTSTSTQQIAAGYVQGRQVGLTFADLEGLLNWWIRHQPPHLIKQLLVDLWWYGGAEDAEKLRRGVAAGRYGGRPVAERWHNFIQERQILAHWLAGKGKPPRRRQNPGGPHQRDRTLHGVANSAPPADSGGGGKFGAVKKIAGNLFSGSKNASGDEHPTADAE